MPLTYPMTYENMRDVSTSEDEQKRKWEWKEMGYSIACEKKDQMDANVKLASKAPDMAELLIKLVDGNFGKGGMGANGFYDLLLEAVRLLKEVGYDPMDKDSAG